MRGARALWLLFFLFIVYGATVPFNYSGASGFFDRFAAVPMNPFVAPDTGRRLSIPDAVQNILLFVPFGALGMLSIPERRRHWLALPAITLLGLAASALVETLQLFLTNRVASTSDLLMNTLGTLAGASLAGAGARLGLVAWQRLQREGLADVPEIRTLLISACVLAIAFLQPFDVTLEVGTVSWKVRTLEVDFWQRSVWRDEGISLLLATLFAMALASYISGLGERRAGRKAALIGVPLVCALEGIQLLVASRMPGLWDATVGATGIVLGAALWTVSQRITSPFLWQGVLVCMTALAAGVQMLSPFEWVGTYRGFGWFPFLGYYTRTTFEALSHVIELALAYFPLGYCLALGSDNRTKAAAVVLMTTLAIAAPIEYLQGWVEGRYPDVTDVGLSLAGACAGLMMGRQKRN